MCRKKWAMGISGSHLGISGSRLGLAWAPDVSSKMGYGHLWVSPGHLWVSFGHLVCRKEWAMGIYGFRMGIHFVWENLILGISGSRLGT